jgi:hypothetical protein
VVITTPSLRAAHTIPERTAEVLGTFLERAGMEEIEISPKAFLPPLTDDLSQLADAFSQFVTESYPKTEYALFSQFLGTPKSGFTEIRIFVIDQHGAVVFTERANEKDFQESPIKPDEPMTACVFVAQRLRDVWQLDDPSRKDAPQGKMAEVMRQRSGMPADKELAAMDQRLQALKQSATTSSVSVYATELLKGSDASSANELTELLNQQGVFSAEISDIVPKLDIATDPNQQKVLWDAARAFREFLRSNPPATEYALLADYGLSGSSTQKRLAHHVHLILCSSSGDWVLVDYQNSHHKDFKTVAPKSHEDCARLAVIRLKQRLSQ